MAKSSGLGAFKGTLAGQIAKLKVEIDALERKLKMGGHFDHLLTQRYD